MAKELDNMKMWAAFLASLSKQTVGEYINSTNLYIDLCSELKRQGFGYKDGGIVPIDGKPELSHSELTEYEEEIKGLLFDAGDKYNLDTDLDLAAKDLAPRFLKAVRKQFIEEACE